MRRCLLSRFFVLLVTLFVAKQDVQAQFEEGKEEDISVPLIGSSIVVSAADSVLYVNLGEDSNKIKNIITLKIDETSNTYLVSSFSATVNFDVFTWVTLASSPVQTHRSLHVNYDKTDGAKYKVRSYITLPSSEKVKIVVTGITIADTTGTWNALDFLQLDNEMRILRYYTLSNNPTILTQPS